MRNLLVAVSFLTRIPVPVVTSSETELASSAPWFPVVGLVVGALSATILVTSALVFGPLLSAAIAVLAGVAVTGAFHEDGLADTFDGFGGGHTPERRLAIMKDSRLGTFGTVALVGALGVQTLAVAELSVRSAVVWLIVAHVWSRSVALTIMSVSEPAGEGLGASYLGALRPLAAAVGIAAGVAISTMIVVAGGVPILLLVGPLIIAMVGGALIRRWSYARIGGVTGDVLGAVQQVAFTTVLLAGVATMSIAASGAG